MDCEAEVRHCLGAIDVGRWVVGVSGGADSVALLVGLRRFRSDIVPIVAHLDHQSRGAESDGDREFVIELCERMNARAVVRKLDEIDPGSDTNLEAKFRSARQVLFAEAVNSHQANGVLLAHHADDRAETILLRLLRGGEPWALDSIHGDRTICDVRVVRPMLAIRRRSLETFLRSINQAWREDSSNSTDAFARNRVRKLLQADEPLLAALLRLGDAGRSLRQWVEAHAPEFGETVPLQALADLPDPLARRTLRKWLRARSVEVQQVSPAQIDMLMSMVRDRASRSAVSLPGGIVARRKRSQITLD